MRSGGRAGKGTSGTASTSGGRSGGKAQRTAGDLPTPRVLREYALVADGERGAVIGPDGSIAWLCVPRWDSPAAFSGLLGGPGQYTITPADPWHVWGGYYESGSLIWRNRWVGDTRIECREALAMPADPHRAVLLRRIEAIDGTAKVTVTLDLRAGYGRADHDRPQTARRNLDRPQRRHLVPLVGRGPGPAHRRPAGDADRARAGEEARSRARAVRSRTHGRAARPGAELGGDRGGVVGRLPGCDDLIALADARHSYAVLRGLTSASGAMVAAATTSLPERLEGGRNYDYRYAWIRDQCYAGIAVAAHGPHPLLTGDPAVRHRAAARRRARADAGLHGGGGADR